MSERARNTLFAAALTLMAALLLWMILSSPTETDRVGRLGASIMCPVCQGESIASSPSDMARDMMALIEDRVSHGATDQAIIDELLGSYTGALLLDPPVSGPTLVLWVAPAVALLVGLGVIIWWRRQPATEAVAIVDPRSRSRRAVGTIGMVAALAAIVMAVGFFLQDRDPALGGVVAMDTGNLEDYSNETMEAVIAAFSDNPQIDGMRLALAERYFREGEYGSAFTHFFAVANSELASDVQVAEALIGLGWMAWDGNQAADAALGLFDQALAIEPLSVTARYLKGQVLWCGTGQPDEAADEFQTLLDRPELPAETRDLIEADLAAIGSGEDCT